MQVQVNTGHHIEADEAMAESVRDVVARALSHFSDHITRVEVHLRDQDGAKNGRDDKRCMMEARLEGRQPIAVTHEAPTVDQAVAGAADQLASRVESTLGRSDRGAGARR
ncbi:MAG: HPF/RaiA family ribosome-associated protein [Gemmatimonadota bacterium]|nr:HPF/RaiA family ribosome-associated protein [Gemmatimonadota bacterium]